MKQLKLNKIWISAIVIALMVGTPEVNLAQNTNQESTTATKTKSTKKFVKDLKRFVRSVSKETYQPEGYWDEVDELYEALQIRKADLESSFSESQREAVRKLERKYQSIRKKKTKLS